MLFVTRAAKLRQGWKNVAYVYVFILCSPKLQTLHLLIYSQSRRPCVFVPPILYFSGIAVHRRRP